MCDIGVGFVWVGDTHQWIWSGQSAWALFVCSFLDHYLGQVGSAFWSSQLLAWTLGKFPVEKLKWWPGNLTDKRCFCISLTVFTSAYWRKKLSLSSWKDNTNFGLRFSPSSPPPPSSQLLLTIAGRSLRTKLHFGCMCGIGNLRQKAFVWSTEQWLFYSRSITSDFLCIWQKRYHFLPSSSWFPTLSKRRHQVLCM